MRRKDLFALRLHSILVSAVACVCIGGCSPTGLTRQSINLVVPQTTYCVTATGTYYSLKSMNCQTGDAEIRSWDYQKGVAAKEEEARKERARLDQMPKATYCVSSKGDLPYTPGSGSCIGDDAEISKSRYDELKSQSRASLTTIPKLEEQAPEKGESVEPVKPADTAPETTESKQSEEPQSLEPPKIESPAVASPPQAEKAAVPADVFCIIIGRREVFLTHLKECPTGSTEISADAYSAGNIVSESDAMGIISDVANGVSQP